jgi:hypothetical protein
LIGFGFLVYGTLLFNGLIGGGDEKQSEEPVPVEVEHM